MCHHENSVLSILFILCPRKKSCLQTIWRIFCLFSRENVKMVRNSIWKNSVKTIGFASIKLIIFYFQHLRHGKCSSIMCRKHVTTKTEFSQFVAFCVQEKTMEPKFGWITPMFWHISINPTYSCSTNVRPVLKPLLKKWQFMITERRFILILKLMSRYIFNN